MSAVLVLITGPIVLMAAIGSAIALKAWPFFSQERVGRDGQIFTFVKIRTLPTSVPAYIDKHSLAGHVIPPFCQVLRRLHLDELPQLYLVLIGRMSLVGPRPEMATLHGTMSPEFAAARTTVRPGCTGLWQISHGCTDLIAAAPKYDSFYLAHRSLRLDVWVMGRTLLQMIGINALVELDQVPHWALPAKSPDVRVIDLTRVEISEDQQPEQPLGMPVTAGG